MRAGEGCNVIRFAQQCTASLSGNPARAHPDLWPLLEVGAQHGHLEVCRDGHREASCPARPESLQARGSRASTVGGCECRARAEIHERGFLGRRVDTASPIQGLGGWFLWLCSGFKASPFQESARSSCFWCHSGDKWGWLIKATWPQSLPRTEPALSFGTFLGNRILGSP